MYNHPHQCHPVYIYRMAITSSCCQWCNIDMKEERDVGFISARMRYMYMYPASVELFGSHPHKAYVPPNVCESIITTLHPAELHSDAAVDAAVPVPITIKSNACFSSSCLFMFLANDEILQIKYM